MSCAYCDVSGARNPCGSRGEAYNCANNEDPGSCLDFKAKDVAAWIRSRAWDDTELWATARLIEDRL